MPIQDLHHIPKVELHCHLIGLISPFVLEMLQREGKESLVSPEVLRRCYPVVGIRRFLDWLLVLKPYQEYCIADIKPVLAYHIESLIQQHVLYTELMMSPTIFSPDIDTLVEEFDQFRKWTIQQERGLVQVEYLMVIPRALPESLFKKNLEVYSKLWQQQLISGIAVVGIENNTSLRRIYPLLKKFKDIGIRIEVHAGEHTGPENVWDALQFGLADRIGHGIGIFQDEKLIDHVRKLNMHLEFALTSNLRLQSVGDIRAHPIQLAHLHKLNFSINTDDPGAFECCLVDEFHLAQQNFSFDEHDFQTIFSNSLASRFQPHLRYL